MTQITVKLSINKTSLTDLLIDAAMITENEEAASEQYTRRIVESMVFKTEFSGEPNA